MKDVTLALCHIASQPHFWRENRILGVIIGTLLPFDRNDCSLRRAAAKQCTSHFEEFHIQGKDLKKNSSVRFPKAQTSSFSLLRVFGVDIARDCSLPGTETAWHDVFPRALTFDRRDYGSRVPEGEGKGNGHTSFAQPCAQSM